MCIGVCLHVRLGTLEGPGALGGKNMASDTLELELEMIVRHQVSAGN